MTRPQQIVLAVIVVGIAVYGCARNPSDNGSGGGGSTSQQAKAKRWEEDFHAAAAARDHYRQKLQGVEEKQAELQRQLEQERLAAATERETLKAELKTRQAERDNLQTQYDGFRKNLKDLLAQAETTLANPSPPSIPTIPSIPTVPTSPIAPATTAPALIGSQPLPPTGGTALSN